MQQPTASSSDPRMVQQKPSLQVFLTQHHLAIAMEYVPGELFSVEPSWVAVNAPLRGTHCMMADRHCSAGSDLYQHVSKYHVREQEARWIFQQLIIGLDYCHSQGVANRDLKLETILLDCKDTTRPPIKISDTGDSKPGRTNIWVRPPPVACCKAE